MKKRNKRGQSTLEYIILVTAIVAIAIVFLNPKSGKMVNTINDTYSTVADGVNGRANVLATSWNKWNAD